MNSKDKLGVDIGGVLIDKVNDGQDTSFFSDNFLNTTAVPGAFDALRTLGERRFGKNIVLVSKCGARVQEKTLLWLAHHDFYARTGVREADVHFCRERKDKAPICKRLGVTHFVDDRLEILTSLTTVRECFLFQPPASRAKQYEAHAPKVRAVQSWAEIVAALAT